MFEVVVQDMLLITPWYSPWNVGSACVVFALLKLMSSKAVLPSTNVYNLVAFCTGQVILVQLVLCYQTQVRDQYSLLYVTLVHASGFAVYDSFRKGLISIKYRGQKFKASFTKVVDPITK